jgi:hypothetical protein
MILFTFTIWIASCIDLITLYICKICWRRSLSKMPPWSGQNPIVGQPTCRPTPSWTSAWKWESDGNGAAFWIASCIDLIYLHSCKICFVFCNVFCVYIFIVMDGYYLLHLYVYITYYIFVNMLPATKMFVYWY